MGLTNTQYDSIMRIYSARQSEDMRDLLERRNNAYARVPALKKIDERVADLAVLSVEHSLSGSEEALEDVKSEIRSLGQLRESTMYNAGFPEDYLEMRYFCPDCQDTGYAGGVKCHCFDALVIDLFYTQSGIREQLEKENFSAFSFDWYDDFPSDEAAGKSPRQNMHDVIAKCRNFIDHFDDEGGSLLLYGETGLGKTFVSNCIAKELIETSHSVIYYSAPDLFDKMAKTRFSGSESAGFSQDYLFNSDLLIIDDLGTEMTNSFVVSSLFRILSERLSRSKSMIISTNMSLGQLSSAYTERSFSRIMEGFTILRFYGKDIRVKKKQHG